MLEKVLIQKIDFHCFQKKRAKELGKILSLENSALVLLENTATDILFYTVCILKASIL